MRVFTSSTLLLLSGVSLVCCLQTLRGYVSGRVNIPCKIDIQIEIQSVLLQKMDISKNVTLIESNKDGETFTIGRYSLYYDSTTKDITATIDDLIREDAGVYWCLTAGYYDEHHTDPVHLEVEHPPPTSKPPLTTGSTSAHDSATGDTHSSRNTRAPELESTSAQGNSNTTHSHASPRSSLRNPCNAEEINGIYAEVQDTDSSADKLQTPPTPNNQRNHQDSSLVISIYTTANQNPEQHPASANQFSETNTEPEDINSLLIYSVATNPMQPTHMSAANHISEIDDTYSVATNPMQPTHMAAANQNSEIDDAYSVATNPILPTDMSAANQPIDDTLCSGN
ncbi:uncharacterized protein LOC143116194 isoform X2 [Alosa pseudoharengus]|uniref:uncharacterized protein LOC143116194 isoform X2 n=1 Tax=Alosa pseudoharengus TaxID=34774 RepID=UPI003F8924C1